MKNMKNQEMNRPRDERRIKRMTKRIKKMMKRRMIKGITVLTLSVNEPPSS
jgi:hypothetical protein